jgi:hypothetical protein
VAFFDKLFKKQTGETQTDTSLANPAAPGDDGAPDVLVEPGVPMDRFGNEVPLPEADYDYPGEYAQRFDGVDPGTNEASGGWYVSKPQVTLQSSDGDAAPGDDSSKWLLTGQMPTGGSMGEAPDADVEAKFEISQPDQQIGSFAELQGINTEVDVVDYVESEQDETLKQMPLDQPDSGFSGQYVVTDVEHHSTEPPTEDDSPVASEHHYELASGKVAQTDHDFETPTGEAGDPTAAPGFFDRRLLSAQDLTTESAAAEGGHGADDANPTDASPQRPSLEGAQPPSDGEAPAVYGYDGAKGDYSLIPAAAEEPVNAPGGLEYPNLTFHVPEADQVTPEPPAGPQGFGFVTFGDAESPTEDLLIGTAIGEAIGNPAGDGSEEDAELNDDGEATLLKLSESPQPAPIHQSDGWDVVLPDDGDADGDEADDDP